MDSAQLVGLGRVLEAVTSTLDRDRVLSVALDETRGLVEAETILVALVARNGAGIDISRSEFRGGLDNEPESWWLARIKSFARETFDNSSFSSSDHQTTKPLVERTDRNHMFQMAFFDTAVTEDLGVFMVSRPLERPFSQEELDVLSLLGREIGVALRNAKLYEEVRMEEQICTLEQRSLTNKLLLSQEQERKRIARDLHDDTCQTLSNVLLRLEMIKASIPPELKHMNEVLDQFKETVTRALEDVHQTAFDLRPSILDDLGLISAIRCYANDFRERCGVSVSFKMKGEEQSLSPEKEIVIFRIIQEALTNIRKHSQTGEACLSLDFLEDRVVVAVEDCGIGFQVDKVLTQTATRKALGILGMKERAELLGGELTIESEPKKRTRIRAEIPFSVEGERSLNGQD